MFNFFSFLFSFLRINCSKNKNKQKLKLMEIYLKIVQEISDRISIELHEHKEAIFVYKNKIKNNRMKRHKRLQL